MIKVIAALLMLIDHIGMVFFPQHFELRMIGRLSMPLFAYCIAQGYYKTRSIEKYMMRMTLFAVISQIPFWLMMYVTGPGYFDFMHFNIGFTFLGALMVLSLYKGIRQRTTQSQFTHLALIMGILILVTLLKCDYGAYGILLVLVFYEFYLLQKNIGLTLLMLIAATLSLYVLGGPEQVRIQLLGVPAFFIILLVKDEPVRKFKYFFYVFYPAHMLILSLIKWIYR